MCATISRRYPRSTGFVLVSAIEGRVTLYAARVVAFLCTMLPWEASWGNAGEMRLRVAPSAMTWGRTYSPPGKPYGRILITDGPVDGTCKQRFTLRVLEATARLPVETDLREIVSPCSVLLVSACPVRDRSIYSGGNLGYLSPSDNVLSAFRTLKK